MIACIGAPMQSKFSFEVAPCTPALLRLSRSLAPLTAEKLEEHLSQMRERGVAVLWTGEGFLLQWSDAFCDKFPFRDPLSHYDVEIVRVNFDAIRKRFGIRAEDANFSVDQSLVDAPLVFCDIETTGSSSMDLICEVSFCLRRKGKPDEWLSSFVNPGVPIRNSSIHGITDRDVMDAPYFGDIAEQIQQLVYRAVFISHSTNHFDETFVARELKTAGLDWTPPAKLSSCLLAKRLLPLEPSHKLQALAKTLGLHVEKAHRAESDVRTMMALWDKLQSVARKQYRPPKTLAQWMRL